MSDLSVTERRLRPIQDAVASRNWKQALQQCDKWQKKGEKSDRFLALRASILINQPDKSQSDKGKAETLQLCQRNPPVTDIEALYQLQNSLKHLSLLHEEGPRLWERAIAARPNDKELLTTLLNGSIGDDNWMSAQKAAMALRKAFPKERQYDFWNILLCYLIHEDQTLPQKDRDLFGRLAFMLISKAAESVPKGKDELIVPGKAISTTEELSLLVKVYRATGHGNDAASVLHSDNLGPRSRLAEHDPQFVFSLLLEALSTSDNHDEVYEVCQKLLSPDAADYKQHIEDDRVWKILRDTCRGSDGWRERSDACQKLAQNTYEKEPKCRTAYLTFFDLAAEGVRAGDGDADSLASACATYYEVFSERPFCFGDLSHPLLAVGASRSSFLSKVKLSDGSVIQQAFALKLRYATFEADGGRGTEAEYLKLVRDAVQLHKQLPKGKSECPEIALLAAMALLDLVMKTQNHCLAIQANYMMQNCYSSFSEYYPLAVRQVQLHLVQAQITQAMEKFASLAVKNMQWETVGHLLLTRISTIHPWQSGTGDKSLNPLAALDDGLVMLESADRTIERAILDGLQYNSYSNIIDSVKVKSNITRSMNRQMFLVEERRIQRLIGVPLDAHLNPYPAKMVDQRDTTFLPSFGNTQSTSELNGYLSCGPLPKEFWLKAMALHDHLVTYLKAELGSHTVLAASTLTYLKTTLEKSKQAEDQDHAQLTAEETSGLQCHQALAEAVLLAREPSAAAQTSFNVLVDKIVVWLDHATTTTTTTTEAETPDTATINGIPTPTWKYLHASFSTLETLQTISLFLGLQSRRTKTSPSSKPQSKTAAATVAVAVSKDTLVALQGKVTAAETAVHRRAQTLKDGITAPGVLGRLVDVAAGRLEGAAGLGAQNEYRELAEVYADLVDEGVLEEYCGRMKESWEDALDGVLRVKVKTVK